MTECCDVGQLKCGGIVGCLCTSGTSGRRIHSKMFTTIRQYINWKANTTTVENLSTVLPPPRQSVLEQ